jgi:hypothetical protein
MAADLYFAGHPGDDPLISPLTADLTGLPPTLIQAAAGDPRSSPARQLAHHARGQGRGSGQRGGNLQYLGDERRSGVLVAVVGILATRCSRGALPMPARGRAPASISER